LLKKVGFWIFLSIATLGVICATAIPFCLRDPATAEQIQSVPVVNPRAAAPSPAPATPAQEKPIIIEKDPVAPSTPAEHIEITASRLADGTGFYWSVTGLDGLIDAQIRALASLFNEEISAFTIGCVANIWFLSSNAEFPTPISRAAASAFVSPEISFDGKIYVLLLVD
jgi:hypothetical protein